MRRTALGSCYFLFCAVDYLYDTFFARWAVLLLHPHRTRGSWESRASLRTTTWTTSCGTRCTTWCVESVALNCDPPYRDYCCCCCGDDVVLGPKGRVLIIVGFLMMVVVVLCCSVFPSAVQFGFVHDAQNCCCSRSFSPPPLPPCFTRMVVTPRDFVEPAVTPLHRFASTDLCCSRLVLLAPPPISWRIFLCYAAQSCTSSTR